MAGDAGRDPGRDGERLSGRFSGPLPLLTGLLPVGDSDRPGRGLRRGGGGSNGSSMFGIPAILDGLLLDLAGKEGVYSGGCSISSSRSRRGVIAVLNGGVAADDRVIWWSCRLPVGRRLGIDL